MEFVMINRKMESAGYQGFTCSIYNYTNDKGLSDEIVADNFLKSGNVEGYAFNIGNLTIENFKKLTKTQCSEILIDFGNEPNWGEDRKEFYALLNKYYKGTEKLGDNNFYVISKDWFKHPSNLILETSEMVYIYCFIIIHVDTSLNSLALYQWVYD